MLLLGKNDGWKLYGPKNELRKTAEKSGLGLPHHRDFIEAIRTDRAPECRHRNRRTSRRRCATWAISRTRLGRTLHFDGASEQFKNDAEANALVRRQYREHWGTPKNV